MLSFEHPHILKLWDLCDRTRNFVFSRNRGQVEADRNLETFYEKAWREAAIELGASIERLGQGVLEVERGGVRTRVLANATALDDLATHCVVRSKAVVYALLAQRGLPVPRHLIFKVDEIDKAAGFLATIDRDCVVKPASDTGGGLGVTTGIRDRAQLARAAWIAARGGRSVLIEEQIEGENIRLLYLDGKLLDAVARRPPVLLADGCRTIEALVLAANQERTRGGLSHSCISFNMDLHQTLKKQGLTLRSIPPSQSTIRLKTVINENSCAENRTVINDLGTDLLGECEQAVRIAGVRLAGVDIITTDPGVSLRQSGGVILEINSPPGYFWHYRKQDGVFPVAVHALRALLERQAASTPILEMAQVGKEPQLQ